MTEDILDPKYPPFETVEQMAEKMRGNLAKHDRLAMIERKHLDPEIFNRYGADFTNQAVSNIRAALAAAYDAGRNDAARERAQPW